MSRSRKVVLILGSLLLASLPWGVVVAQEQSAPNRLMTTREAPNAFGTDAYTVTTVSAMAFFPDFHLQGYATSGSLGRFGDLNTFEEFYAALDIPAGAVIDFIGLNSTTDTDFALGVALYTRNKFGILGTIGTFSSTVHGWDTDFNVSPIGYLWTGQTGNALILNVEQAPNPTPQFFGWVEVWWRRSVSPAPGAATFNDVPTNHPFFQYIEALAAAGITGGCGGGNYCPDNPLTRGQMAVFLSKALGLHWPGN
jgi:S-layer homology domain